MTDTVTFYHNPMSRGRIVHWMLEEIGEPYATKVLSFEKREHKSPEYLAVNPMGKIPAIVHRGTVVTEAAAICAYLADAFPHAGLAPAPGDAARGTYYRWLFFAAGCLEPALIDRMFDRPRVEREGALGYGNYTDTLNALETAVTPGPFILGERFSAADVYVASEIAWGTMTKTLEPRPVFKAYFDRCTARPAARRVFATQT
jgi:glutathione S-transferase